MIEAASFDVRYQHVTQIVGSRNRWFKPGNLYGPCAMPTGHACALHMQILAVNAIPFAILHHGTDTLLILRLQRLTTIADYSLLSRSMSYVS